MGGNSFQLNPEAAAVSQLRDHTYLAPHPLDDLANNSQTNAGSFIAGGEALEHSEEPALGVLGDADAVILDKNPGHLSVVLDAQAYLRLHAGCNELHRVTHQVRKALRQEAFLSQDNWQGILDVDFGVVDPEVRVGFDETRDQAREVYWVQGQLLQDSLGVVESVFDELIQSRGTCDNASAGVQQLGRGLPVGGQTFVDDPRKGAHGTQRSSHIMSDGVGNVLQLSNHLAQLSRPLLNQDLELLLRPATLDSNADMVG